MSDDRLRSALTLLDNAVQSIGAAAEILAGTREPNTIVLKEGECDHPRMLDISGCGPKTIRACPDCGYREEGTRGN